MADIEQQNIEKNTTWWDENKINKYENPLKWKEIGKTETEKEHNQANELLTQIQETKETETKKETINKYPSTLSPEIKTAINQLNRPEAQEGIAQSYANMDNTIKNSKNEKWIAGFLGKIMNKILG